MNMKNSLIKLFSDSRGELPTFNPIHLTGSLRRQSATVTGVLGNGNTLKNSGCSTFATFSFVTFALVKFSVGKCTRVTSINRGIQPKKEYNYIFQQNKTKPSLSVPNCSP